MERERLEKKKKLEQDKLDGEKGSANKVNFHHTINFHWSLFIQVFSFTYEMPCGQKKRISEPEFGFNVTANDDLT
jgi:hypothetical protein